MVSGKALREAMPAKEASQDRELPASSVAIMESITSGESFERAPRLAMGKASKAKGGVPGDCGMRRGQIGGGN